MGILKSADQTTGNVQFRVIPLSVPRVYFGSLESSWLQLRDKKKRKENYIDNDNANYILKRLLV